MAEASVRLPPDSVGTRLRTLTDPAVADGAHQEVVTLALADGTLADPATQTTLAAVLAHLQTPQPRVLLDYSTRLDGNPVYVGKAPQATLTSASTWVVQRFSYDSSARLTDVQVLTGAWDSRATLGWA